MHTVNFELYPITFQLNGKLYYSIWCSNDLSNDIFYTINSKIITFSKHEYLRHYSKKNNLAVDNGNTLGNHNFDLLKLILNKKLYNEHKKVIKLVSEYELTYLDNMNFIVDLQRTYNKEFKMDDELLNINDFFFTYRKLSSIESLTNKEFQIFKKFVINSCELLSKSIINYDEYGIYKK